MNISVIGTGYVGLVTGACLSYLGHHVTCIDVDESKIRMLKNGEVPIYEPLLDQLIEQSAQRGGLEYTTDLAAPVAASEVIFIAVGTPPLPNGEANLSYLEAAAKSIGRAIDSSRYRVIINKSTVPVGSGNLVEALVREGVREAHPELDREIKFDVASNPEFLREGRALTDSLFPDRIVLGASSPQAFELLTRMYEPLVAQEFDAPPFLTRPPHVTRIPIIKTTLQSAEMIKYASNAFLALKIGFANEMSGICERVGADVTEVMRGIGLDSRIGPQFLNAGLGWGGSCFGKDTQSLLHTAIEYGLQARLLESSLAVNYAQRMTVIQKLQERLFILKGRTIGLLGLAFKPDTDDLRDAPALQLAEKLLRMGARVKAYDPVATEACRKLHPELNIQYCPDPYRVAEEAHGIVLVTEWSEFRNLDLAKLASVMTQAILVDGRNLFDPSTAFQAGFDYCGIGRPLSVSRELRHLHDLKRDPVTTPRVNGTLDQPRPTH